MSSTELKSTKDPLVSIEIVSMMTKLSIHIQLRDIASKLASLLYGKKKSKLNTLIRTPSIVESKTDTISSETESVADSVTESIMGGPKKPMVGTIPILGDMPNVKQLQKKRIIVRIPSNCKKHPLHTKIMKMAEHAKKEGITVKIID